MELGHEWTVFYTCGKCGIGQYDAVTLGIVCGAVKDEDEADTPILIEMKPDG